MKIVILSVLLSLFGAGVSGFTTPNARTSSRQPQQLPQQQEQRWDLSLSSTDLKPVATTVLTTVVSSLWFPVAAWAEDTEYVMAELPPPYVPALFGVGLLAGVGLLTGSLGNVMDEEASLGLQSGARAKKEIERSRSSYFKK